MGETVTIFLLRLGTTKNAYFPYFYCTLYGTTCKVNVQKATAFLYTSNEQMEILNINIKNIYKNYSKRNARYLAENYKILLRKNKELRYDMFTHWKNQYHQDVYSPSLIYRFNVILIKISIVCSFYGTKINFWRLFVHKV